MDRSETGYLERRKENREADTEVERNGQKKKTRRSKPIQNQLKKFSLYYLNIRDFATKKEALEEILDEIKPTVVAITETHLEGETSLELRGYCKPFRNDRNKDGVGILIAVRKELGNIAVEVSQTKEVYESLWIAIDNNKVKLKIGVVYFPQENTVTLKDISNIYKLVKKEISEGREKDQSVIIAGDFNCKVGDTIEGNIGPVSKGGKKLIKMIEKEKLCLTNASEKCEGKWTREENGKKSILDYIIIEQEDEKYLRQRYEDRRVQEVCTLST